MRTIGLLPGRRRSNKGRENDMNRVGRATVGLAYAAALLSVGLGVGAGIAQADDGDWGPPHHWCPGDQLVPATGNHVTDPLNWDWNVCHTYYFLAGNGQRLQPDLGRRESSAEAGTADGRLLRPGGLLPEL